MKKILLAFGAMSLAVPAMAVIPAGKAEASVTRPVAAFDSAPQRYKKKKKNHAYREWRGRDGRTYCRKPDGTTGLIVGAVGGALVGRTIDTNGDRSAGTLIGAVAGGLAGREIDRSSSRRRCR